MMTASADCSTAAANACHSTSRCGIKSGTVSGLPAPPSTGPAEETTGGLGKVDMLKELHVVAEFPGFGRVRLLSRHGHRQGETLVHIVHIVLRLHGVRAGGGRRG